MSKPRAPLGLAAKVWAKIAVPKIFTITMVGTYLLLLTGWGPGLVDPPNSLEGLIGLVSIYLVSALIVIGAVTGVPTAVVGQHRVEKFSVLAVLVGVLMYVLMIHILHWTGTGNRLPQAQTILALSPVLVARLVWVWRRPVAPADEVLIPVKDTSDEE